MWGVGVCSRGGEVGDATGWLCGGGQLPVGSRLKALQGGWGDSVDGWLLISAATATSQAHVDLAPPPCAPDACPRSPPRSSRGCPCGS